MNKLAKALIKQMIYKALPVGTVRQHKDGKYKKVNENTWVKVTEGEQKENIDQQKDNNNLSQNKEIVNLVKNSNSINDFAHKILSGELLDKIAFGISSKDNKIDPKKLNIKYKTDIDNVIIDQQKSGLSPLEYAKKIDLSEPIEVSYEKGKYYIEDGHHRYYAAKLLNKPLNMELNIKDNPFKKLGIDNVDSWIKETFNNLKGIKK